MARGIQKRLNLALRRVSDEINAQARSGDDFFSRGLAGEGWQGGYRQALSDIELLLRGIEPNDSRTEGYWQPTLPDSP